MLYYLKKNWKLSSLVCLLEIGEWGMQAVVALIMIKCLDAAFALDMKRFLFWTVVNVASWGLYFAISILQETTLALVTLHWTLLLVSLFIALVMWGAPKLFEKKMESLGEACSKEQAEAVSSLKNLLRGFDVLHSFGREDRFLQEGDAASDRMEQPVYHLNCVRNIIYGLLGYVNVVAQFLTDIFVVALAVKGSIGIAAIGGAGNLTGGVATGLDNLAKYRLSLSAARPYFSKITVHEDGKQDVQAARMEKMKNAITTEHLGFSYGEKTVLSDLNLCFERNKKYAVTGASGCGKSTLLKILLGWLPDYTGTVLLDTADARTYTAEQLGQEIGYIEQDVFLFHTSIRENLTLGEEFTEEQLQKALKESALLGDLDQMPAGLETIVGEEGNNLSGGQKQRVAIARALLHECSVLLVDEGTSALDKETADVVEQSLLAKPDLTLILVSHHLSEERKMEFDAVYEL